MNASFEEKSTWVQLASLLVGLGGYFIAAGPMVVDGIHVLPVYVPLFVVAVVIIVAINVVGHVVVAIVEGRAQRDERDRLIGWRAESNAAWILGVGVILAITGLIVAVEPVWIAHGLLLALFIAEVVKYAMQLRYYRWGL